MKELVYIQGRKEGRMDISSQQHERKSRSIFERRVGSTLVVLWLCLCMNSWFVQVVVVSGFTTHRRSITRTRTTTSRTKIPTSSSSLSTTKATRRKTPFFCPLLILQEEEHRLELESSSRLQNSRDGNDEKSCEDEDEDDNDDDDDDDDEDYEVAENDWRDFRAQLVMRESKEAAQQQQAGATTTTSSSSSSCSSSMAKEPYVEDGDLDGIGALFSDVGYSSPLSSTPTSSSHEEEEEEEEEMSTLSSSSSSSNNSTTATTTTTTTLTPLDPSQWAYDSGTIIEQGTVILGGVEQDFGFGLRQQYFHKAAILVLEHDENTFTKGIILNRPTDITLLDDVNDGVQWRVWFGGDVQGWNSMNPDIVCLHSLKDPQVKRASLPLMKDIQWTTFDNAKRLVHIGVAKPTDFWVFIGYAGWGPHQLMGELERKSWYMVATDSQTLLKQLAKQSSGSDPREAGLDTWTLLMNMIGRNHIVQKYSGNFDDLMLKEWAHKYLLSDHTSPATITQIQNTIFTSAPPDSLDDTLREDPLQTLIRQVQQQKQKLQQKTKQQNQKLNQNTKQQFKTHIPVKAGTLLRASSADRSPFLLKDQQYHKSVVLVLSHDDTITVGIILNRPAPKGLGIQLKQMEPKKNPTSTQHQTKTTLPVRFGGQYAVKGKDTLLFLHHHPLLKAAQIGAPVSRNAGGGGPSNTMEDDDPLSFATTTTSPTTKTTTTNNQQYDHDEYWKCTAQQMIDAISRNLASPDDFIVVSGVSVWIKRGTLGAGWSLFDSNEEEAGLLEDIQQGRFQPIPPSLHTAVWDALMEQQEEVLMKQNFQLQIQLGNDVWECCCPSTTTTSTNNNSAEGKPTEESPLPLDTDTDDHYDEQDDTYVFRSNVKVSQLSDDALKKWMAQSLLQDPTL